MLAVGGGAFGHSEQCCPSVPLARGWFYQKSATAGSPRIDGNQARFPISKLKLDNLFLQWLSMTESQSLVKSEELSS